MKVFVVPALQAKTDMSAFLTARDIISLLDDQGLEVSVSAPEGLFKCGKAYPAASPSKPLFTSVKTPRSLEEDLYGAGTASASYLRRDIELMRKALAEEKPDVILDLGRVSALITSRLTGIPVISLVSGGMFRGRNFERKALQGVNETLSGYKFEQIFRISDLYAWSDKLFTIGPASLDPITEEERLVRIGYLPYLPDKGSQTNKVFVVFTSLPDSPGKVENLLSDTFKGAPYPVEIWYPGCDIVRNENLHYSSLRISRLSEARVLIHDGSDYMFRQALVRAIPQVIVNDGSWNKARNAACLNRRGFGASVPADDLTVPTLYENYRRILANDSYLRNAEILRQEALAQGGGEVLLDMLSQIRR